MQFRHRINHMLRHFLQMESSGGIVMLCVTALALMIANSPLHTEYLKLIHPLHIPVNDGLMVIFFLLVGLELKREMKEGFLQEKSQILLPLGAAIGGMAIPALIYTAINIHHPEHLNGWAIPSATDIAFALCVLMLAGKHFPPAGKIFLLAIAIFDDLGAILIIALFYSGALNLGYLAICAGLVAIMAILNHKHVIYVPFYMICGIILCYSLHHAGIHTTIGGVITAFFIPMKHRNPAKTSPVETVMHTLHPYVAFLILPLFAFVNAGVNFNGVSLSVLLGNLPMGIMLGLFFGKPIGILFFTWLLVKMRKAKLPSGTNWTMLFAISSLAGIGFTMSLFIGGLAFPREMQDAVKIGVFGGSLLSALCGAALLRYSIKSKE